MSIFLGIDTSCYTTSVAAVSADGRLLADLRQVLRVGTGERGLQQSAAVFQHVQNLPSLLEEISGLVDLRNVCGIAASTRPRPVTGSYMPVFTVSAGQARIMAQVLRVPLVETSHQEGHLTAGIWSAGGPGQAKFLAVHLSGGTTELLLVEREPGQDNNGQAMFDITLLGGTTDLHAGQFIDRVGVRLGIPFPAGPGLELLARQGTQGRGLIPAAVQGYELSFSGPESQAQRLIERGTPPEQVARAVEVCIAKSLLKLMRHGLAEHRVKEVLVVGGVAANQFIRSEVRQRLDRDGVKACFADPSLSSDNAVGVALTARQIIQAGSVRADAGG